MQQHEQCKLWYLNEARFCVILGPHGLLLQESSAGNSLAKTAQKVEIADVAPSIKNSQMASPQNCRPDATQTQRSANATQRERVLGRDSARDATQRERNAA